MSSFLAALQALPELIALMNRLCDAVLRLVAIAKDYELQKWIADLEESIDQLEKAQTAEEKLNAAKALANSIRNLH